MLYMPYPISSPPHIWEGGTTVTISWTRKPRHPAKERSWAPIQVCRLHSPALGCWSPPAPSHLQSVGNVQKPERNSREQSCKALTEAQTTQVQLHIPLRKGAHDGFGRFPKSSIFVF